MEIVAGDIGGTKSWLVWAQAEGRRLNVRFEHIYASTDFLSAEALMQRFVEDSGAHLCPECVCLALPGPVVPGQPVRLTNLDWTLDQMTLQSLLGAQHLWFINDFQAAAQGVETLQAEDYVPLNNSPALPLATRAITGAGTGLGLAWMQVDDAGHYRTFATEGGHTDFAPANSQQERLLAFMRGRFSHVSWERVLSGPGVNQVYQFCLQDVTGEIPAPLRDRNGAVVNAEAEAGDPVAIAAMRLFTDIYANWVGNIALFYQPRGGLYLGGGISARIQPWLQARHFLDACFDKGRMAGLASQVPIYLVTNTRLGLQGALAAAMGTTH